jgi:hypothetical protein
VHDDLMLCIHQSLRIVPLEYPVGSGHLRRLVIGHIALDLFATFPYFGFLLLKKLIQSLDLVLEPLHLLLPPFTLRSCQLIFVDVLSKGRSLCATAHSRTAKPLIIRSG